MKVGHFLNITNVAYNYVRFLRARGCNAELVIDCNDFIMSHPQWEEGDFELGNLSLYSPRFSEGLNTPDWVRYVAWKKPEVKSRYRKEERLRCVLQDFLRCQSTDQYISVLDHVRLGVGSLNELVRMPRPIFWVHRWQQSSSDFIKAMREYDVLHTWALSTQCAKFSGTPYIAHPVGWDMYNVSFRNDLWGRLQREGLKKAKYVIVGSPQLLDLARKLGLKNTYRMNTMIDTEKYQPMSSPLRSLLEEKFDFDILVFSPARQDWVEKGNDKLIRAFARLTSTAKRTGAFLLLTDWGPDLEKSKELVRRLGLERKVVFMQIVAKRKLIEYYNASDVIADSFGSHGYLNTSTMEAMSCGKLVMSYISEEKYKEFVPEVPPILNARTEDEIQAKMFEVLEDRSLRVSIGQRAREYIVTYHGWQNLIDELLELYELAMKKG